MISKYINQRYQIHTYTMLEGWVSYWTVTDSDGVDCPDSYETIALAWDEINGLMEEVQFEIDSGMRDEDEGYDIDEFRIYDTVEKLYVS